MRNHIKYHTRRLCETASIAALYVALTFISAAFGMSSGAVQLRLSEALCVLAVFTPAAVPGVAIGCFAADLLTGCAALDILIGTLASYIGMLGCRLLRGKPYIAPLPYAMTNIAIIPLILAFAYGAEEGLPLLYLSVGIGELLSVFVIGLPLYAVLDKNKSVIFK